MPTPYTPPTADTEKPSRKQIWPRMCRLSIYFTIVGATLSIYRYRIATQMADQSKQLESMITVVDAYLSSLYLTCAFTLLGFTTFILSLVMMRKSRNQLNS